MIYTKIGRRGNVAPLPSKTPYWNNKNQNNFMSQFEPIVKLPTYSPSKGLGLLIYIDLPNLSLGRYIGK